MSKNNETEQKQQSQELTKLLNDGQIVLTAKTRDELQAKAFALIAEAKGQSVTSGAVGQDRETGVFSLRLDIIK